jgi:hypothetical protein
MESIRPDKVKTTTRFNRGMVTLERRGICDEYTSLRAPTSHVYLGQRPMRSLVDFTTGQVQILALRLRWCVSSVNETAWLLLLPAEHVQ